LALYESRRGNARHEADARSNLDDGVARKLNLGNRLALAAHVPFPVPSSAFIPVLLRLRTANAAKLKFVA
jgi:hypothetical protein